MKEYVVVVKLGEDAICLEAESRENAIKKAKDIIGEQYGYELAGSSTVSYQIEGEVA